MFNLGSSSEDNEYLYSLGLKWCSWGNHQQPLSLEDFNKDPSKKDGLKSYCRTCQSIQAKAYANRQVARMNDDYTLDIGVNSIPMPEMWGDGLAKLVEPSTKETFELVVFVSDMHAPYHDKEVIGAAVELVRDLQPHRLVINGDTNDFFALSRFNKALERMEKLQEELNMGFNIRQEFRKAAPDAWFDETMGNHDERLLTYVAVNANALKSLDALKPEKLLRLDELEIHHHPRNGFRLREDFLVEHGQVVRKDAGASAKARLNDTLISGIMGHTHRLGSAFRSGYRDLRWYEQGNLCMRNADYVIGETNWQQGIAVGMFSTKSPNFNVELVPTVGRGFIFGGKKYGDVEAEPNLYGSASAHINLEEEIIYPLIDVQPKTALTT